MGGALTKCDRSEELLANHGRPNHNRAAGIGTDDEEDDSGDADEYSDNDAADAEGLLDDADIEAMAAEQDAAAAAAAGMVTDTSREAFHVEEGRWRIFHGFVAKQAKMRDARDAKQNQLTRPSDVEAFRRGGQFRYGDHDVLRAKLATMISEFTSGQRAAYDGIVQHLDGRKAAQLVSFVSGEGGTGKSYLITALDLYARVHWGKTPGTGARLRRLAVRHAKTCR